MRRFAIYDVFTERALAGNPLAVVYDGEGLSDETMAAIAREFNLSETVFVLPAEQAAHTARIRIFTPGRELPFAGHPTVGTAIALAEQARSQDNPALDLVSVLEEKIGPVRCAISLGRDGPSFCEFDLPQLATQIHLAIDREGVARALGLAPQDIMFENHIPSVWSAGVPYLTIPVKTLGDVERVEFNPQAWERVTPFCEGHLTSAYIYCRGGVNHKAHFHTRMFSADLGIHEDPATGSAAAAFSGAIKLFDALPDGHHPFLLEQGIEMGRPSFIHLHIDTKEGKISRTRIGGHAICISEGHLNI